MNHNKEKDASFIKVVGPSFERVSDVALVVSKATGWPINKILESKDKRFVCFLNPPENDAPPDKERPTG